MDARLIDNAGGFPIMSEPEFTHSNDTFRLIYEAAIRLRAGGMSESAAIKVALAIYDSLSETLNGENDNA